MDHSGFWDLFKELDGILKVRAASGGFCEDTSGFEQADNLVGTIIKIFWAGKD
jgi:hypothetical protein